MKKIQNKIIQAVGRLIARPKNTNMHSDTERLVSENAALLQQVAGLRQKLDDSELQVALAERELQLTKSQLRVMSDKWRVATERNQKLEIDAREIAAEGILMRAHEISKNTTMVVLTTKNMSIVNHASFANLTNRLQNICRHLDAIVLVCDDMKVDQMDADEAAKAHNIVAIPWSDDWRDSTKRDLILARTAELFDLYSRDRYAYNGTRTY